MAPNPDGQITEEDVIAVLKSIIDRDSGKSVHELGFVRELAIDGSIIRIKFQPSNPACPVGLKLAYDVKMALIVKPEVEKVDIEIIGHKHSEDMNKLLADMK